MGRTKLANRQLPSVNIFPSIGEAFEEGQLELGGTGRYQIVGGVTPPEQLATPSISFGTSTSSQNVINWTRPTDGVNSTLQVLIGATWTTIYTGALLTYTHTGLAAETEFDYRVKATATGFTDSDWATGSKTTAAESGGGLIDYSGPYDQFENITQDGNSHVHVPGSGTFGFSRSQKVFPYGIPFEVTFDADLLKGTGVVIVSAGTGITPLYEQIISMFWQRNTDTNGRFKGSTLTDELNDYSDVTVSGSTPIGRIWSDGTELFADKSFDDGATFTEIDASKTIVWPSGQDLRLKTFFDQADDKTIPNMKQEGLT